MALTDYGTMIGWWDTSNAGSITATGGLVDQINDLSGNGRHLTATGGNRPATGTRTINGKNVFDFDATDTMATGSFTETSQPITVLMIVQADDTTSVQNFIDGIATSNRASFGISSGGGSYFQFAGSTITGGTPDATARLWVATFNGASSTVKTGGATIVSGSAGTNTLTGVTIGSRWDGGNKFNGAIGEIGVYSSITAANLLLAMTELEQKWFATTYYVNFTTGNDSTGNGLTAGTAWKTLMKAHDTIPISGGSVVNLAAATHTENSGSGYGLFNRVFTNEVRFLGAGVDSTIIQGASGTDTLRSTGGCKNLTFEDLTIRPISGAKAWHSSNGGDSLNLKFDNVKFLAVGGTLGGTAGFILANAATISNLTLNDCQFDSTAATDANALVTSSIMDGLTVSGTLTYTGPGSSNVFRIQEAKGTHTWSATTTINVTNAAAGITYEGTAEVATISMGATNAFTVDSNGDDAVIISGGTGSGARMTVTLGANMNVSGAGGVRVDGYCGAVTVAAGGVYDSNAASPALSIGSDGPTNDITSVTVGAVTVTNTGGHGGLFGVGTNSLTITGGTYDGQDHSLVIKTAGFTVAETKCLTASSTSLLIKGGTDGTVKYCRLENSQSGGYCIDVRNQDATLSDSITIKRNLFVATGSAKAVRIGATVTEIGNAVTEDYNQVSGNVTADILGTACTTIPGWKAAWSSYAVKGNSAHDKALPRGARLAGWRWRV